MTQKAQRLAMELFEETKKTFPEIEFLNIEPHPEQHRRFWINVKGKMTEERHEALREFVATRAIDLIIKHHYSFTISLDTESYNYAHHRHHEMA